MFTANVFALMGLWQLHFLLANLLQQLVYLSQGLAVSLFFIGVELVRTRCTKTSCPSSTEANTSTSRRSPPCLASR